MTWDEMLDAFATGGEEESLAALEWLLAHWDDYAAPCRALLAAAMHGGDASERTERALFYVLHALGDKADTAAHADLCRLAADDERANLILGDDASAVTLPCILVSTFDGDTAGLQRVVEGSADASIAGDALLVLAYLARTRVLPDGWIARYLAELLDRPGHDGESFVWFAWVKAVSALGLAGFAPQAERLLRTGRVDPMMYDSKSFWRDLRTAKDDPEDMSDPAWTLVGPLGNAIDEIAALTEGSEDAPIPETPVLKPMRDVGRNDPCPCGSGKKYKKCCIGVA